MATTPSEARKNLYAAMTNAGYAGSLDEFEQMYSEPENLKNLHRAMSENYGYDGDVKSFANMYFSDIIKKKIQDSPQEYGVGSSDSSNGSPTSEPLPEGIAGPEQVPFPDVQPSAEAQQPDTPATGLSLTDKLLSNLGSFEKGVVQDVVASPLKAVGQIQGMLTRSLGGEDFKDEDSWFYQAGKALQKASDDLLYEDPELKKGLTSQVSRGVGQAIGMIASSPSMAAKAPQLIATSKSILQEGAKQFFSRASAIGALQMVNQEFEELDQQKALADSMTREEFIYSNGGNEKAGSTYDVLTSASTDELKAQLLPGALAAGSTEMVPIASMFNRLNKITGGSFTKRALQFVKEKGVALFEGAAQEALQEAMTNMSAAEVYDATKSITDGLEEAATVGGATQLVLELMLSAVSGRRVKAGEADMATIRQAEDLIRQKQELLAENLIKQVDESSQAEGEAAGQEQPAATPEIQAEDQPVERTVDDILDNEEDITVLKESFIADRRSDDAQADFDEWIQTLPETEREVAAIRQEEIILARKLRDIQSQMTENQGANTEDTADVGTEQGPTAQGNELPNNVLTSENEQQTTTDEEAPTPTNEAEIQGEQSSAQEAQVATEITGDIFQPGVDENVRQEAFARIEKAGINPNELKAKVEAAKKLGVDVVLDEGDGGSTTAGDKIVVRVGLNSKNPSSVLGHEIAHAALYKSLGDNKQSAPRKRLRSVVESSLEMSAEDSAALQQFLGRYPKSERNDEFLAESLALLASGKAKIKQSALEKVVTAVRELASKALGTPIKYNIDNDADVRRMFKALAGAISGKTGKDLNDIISNVVSKAYPDINQVEQYVAKHLPSSVKNNPNFKVAVKFIQEADTMHSDQDIAKLAVKALGFSPFEVTELFEAALGRKYRGLHPMQQTQNTKFEYFQKFGLFTKFKEKAYRADMYIRNAGTFLYRQVKEIESRLGISLPENLNPYEAFQLWKPKAAFTEKTINDQFFGDGSKESRSKSFIGRLVSSGISTSEFNEFMVAQHAPERYERIVEMWEDNVRDQMRKIELDIHKAGNKDAKGFLPDMKRFPLSPEMIQLAKDRAKDSPRHALKLEEKLIELEKAYDKLNQMVEFQQKTYDKLGSKKLDKAREFFSEFQRDYLNKFVDVLEQGGMVDEKRASFLRNGVSDKSDVVWQSYVPMLIKDEVHADENGEFHDPLGRDYDTLASNVYNNGIHGLTGSIDFDIEDMRHPLDVAYHRLINAVKAVEYNNAMRVLADFTRDYVSPDRARIVKSRAVPKVNEFGDIEGVDDYTPEIVKNKGHAFRMPNGKLAYIYFKDPNDGIRNILTSNRYPPDAVAQWFINKARLMNNFYRSLLITYNPSFMVGNPFRDAQEAFANIRSEYNVRGMRRELSKRMGLSLAFFTRERGPLISRLMEKPSDQEDGAMKEMADYWDEAQRMGVRMSWAMVSEPVSTESVQQRIDEIESAMLNGDRKTAMKLAKKIDSVFSSAADVSENIVRLAAYSALRNKGVTAQKAAYIARNITVDFEKRGASKFLNSFITPLYLFLNVGIQGAGRGLKLFTTKGGRASLAMMSGVYALNRILLYELAGIIGGDDEEEFRANYINNDFIRRNYSLIFNPFDPKNPIRIPKPYSPVRMISSMAENFIDKAYGTRTIGDAVSDMFLDATTVIDPVSGGSGNWPSYAPFALIHPVIEAGLANQDWMGNQILRARDKGVDAYTYNSSTEAKKFNFGAYEVPIGKAYVKGAQWWYWHTPFDVSPTTLEYLSDSYFFKIPPMKAMGNVEDAISEYMKEGDPLKLAGGITSAAGGSKLYGALDEKEKQVLFNFFDIADRTPLRGMTDFHFEQLKKSLRIIRKNELADNRTINAWLETMKLKFPSYEKKIERLK